MDPPSHRTSSSPPLLHNHTIEMPAFERRRCLTCESSHIVVTSDEEKNLWLLLQAVPDLSDEEKENICKVLQDVSAAKTCANKATTLKALALQQERNNQSIEIGSLEGQLKEHKRTIGYLQDDNAGLVQEKKAMQQIREVAKITKDDKNSTDLQIARPQNENTNLIAEVSRLRGRVLSPIENRRKIASARERSDTGSRRSVGRRDRPRRNSGSHDHRRALSCTICYQEGRICNGTSLPCRNCRRTRSRCTYGQCHDFRDTGRCDKPKCTFVHNEKGFGYDRELRALS